MPAKLCLKALEMFRDDRNAAVLWVQEHAANYLPGLNEGEPPAGTYTGYGGSIDAGQEDDTSVRLLLLLPPLFFFFALMRNAGCSFSLT